MGTRTAVAIVVFTGLIAFALAPVLWPKALPPGMSMPEGFTLASFVGLSVIEALSLGVGIFFLVAGYPLVRGLRAAGIPFARASYVAVAWQLMNWWPHDNLHMAGPFDAERLAAIEWGFHVTLMLSAAVIARTMLAVMARFAERESKGDALGGIPARPRLEAR